MATWYSRERADGSLAWYTKIKHADGSWKPFLMKQAKTETQAKKLALEIEKERERAGLGLPAVGPFVGNFADLCAWALEVHFSKKGSAQSDGSRLKQHAGDPEKGTSTWLGALPLRSLSGPVFARYFTEVEAQPTVRGGPPAASSINRLRSIFATVFEVAHEHGYWIGDNPVHATRARDVIDAGHDILQAHEVAPVLAACAPYWRGCLAVGILAGLRKGELFGLKKLDVDLERRVLMVRRSHDRETTKSGKHAAVPIHEDLVPYLEEALKSPGPWLFPNHEGEQRSRHTDLPRILQMALVRAGFIDHWEYVCRRSGCGYRDEQPAEDKRDCPQCGFRLQATPRARHIVWHEGTRHTLASHALMGGASLAGVQAILRHADPRLTIKTYGHLNAGYLGDEVNRVRLPGLAAATPRGGEPTSTGDTERNRAKTGEIRELPPAVAHTSKNERGASMVHGAKLRHQSAAAEAMNEHQNSLGSSWSRGVSNPGPMHCESNPGLLAVAPPLRTASQVLGNAHTPKDPNSTPLHPLTPRPRGRGASMVHGTPLAHHEIRNAKGLGSGRITEQPDRSPLAGSAGPGNGSLTGELLTVKQVAARLSVGPTWVRRRIETGELPAVKTHPSAPRLIPARALDDYLARFPGVAPPEPPEPRPAPATAKSRKGAA